MGLISKEKPDGTMKHRVIMDLRRNRVNEACALRERQVLPTLFSHASDLAVLGRGATQRTDITDGYQRSPPAGCPAAPTGSASAGSESEDWVVVTLILDFADAFMAIPLADAERPFNVSAVDVPLRRGRKRLFHGEVASGTHVAWRVLGVGGKPNPP